MGWAPQFCLTYASMSAFGAGNAVEAADSPTSRAARRICSLSLSPVVEPDANATMTSVSAVNSANSLVYLPLGRTVAAAARACALPQQNTCRRAPCHRAVPRADRWAPPGLVRERTYPIPSVTWAASCVRPTCRCRSFAAGGLHEAALVGEDDCLHAVAGTEFHEQMANVRLHRGLADRQLTGDLGVGEAASQ